MTDVSNIDTARAARDVGMARVRNNNPIYIKQARALIITQLPAILGTGEDIRVKMMPFITVEPSSMNVWGSIISGLVKDGILADTGIQGQMKTKKSHARKSTIYHRTEKVLDA